MGKNLELQIQGDTTNFTFDQDGEWFPRRIAAYKEAANPPEVVELRDVWEFRGCRIVSSDGTTATLWTSFLAFLARFETRGSAFPTYVRLVRDPGGAAAVLLTLGPSDYEQFKVEAIDGETDDIITADTWRRTAVVTIRVSAVRKFTDANGIVGWDQAVRIAYEAGLKITEWRTTVTTKEGTSAVTKAQSYASIPTTALGGDTSYETNGPNGIDYEYTDADEQNSRTPTVCIAVSRIRQWGTTVGATSQGGSPDRYEYTIATRTTPEEETTTTSAEAEGPNALVWVTARAPLVYEEKEIIERRARRIVSGTWIRRRRPTAAAAELSTIRVTISGGHQVVDFVPTVLPHRPVRFDGGYAPWVATVDILVERRASSPKRSDMRFPGQLTDGWALMYDESSETDPHRVELAQASQFTTDDLWRREAHLVYRASAEPTASGSLLEQLTKAPPTESYYLGAGKMGLGLGSDPEGPGVVEVGA